MLPEGIHQISLPVPFGVGNVNTWLLTGEPLTLVDAGPLMDEAEAALDAGLAAHGVAAEDLELIVLTHQHVDHTGLAGRLAERSGARVAGTAKLARVHGRHHRERRRGRRLLDRADAPPRGDGEHGGDARVDQPRVPPLPGRRRRRTRIIADRGELVAGGRIWRVHERPGHSPTDTVLAGDGADDHRRPPAREDLLQPRQPLPIGAPDPVALAASPDRPRTLLMYDDALAATAAEDRGELILPGHGDTFTGARELIERRFGMTERRAGKILAALDEPRTAAAIGRDLWRYVPVTQAYLVLSEVLGHLDLLEARGAVTTEERGGVVVYARA